MPSGTPQLPAVLLLEVRASLFRVIEKEGAVCGAGLGTRREAVVRVPGVETPSGDLADKGDANTVDHRHRRHGKDTATRRMAVGFGEVGHVRLVSVLNRRKDTCRLTATSPQHPPQPQHHSRRSMIRGFFVQPAVYLCQTEFLCKALSPPLPTNCSRRCRWSQPRAGLGSFPVAPASRRRFAPVVARNRRRDAGATAKDDVRGELVGKIVSPARSRAMPAIDSFLSAHFQPARTIRHLPRHISPSRHIAVTCPLRTTG